MLVFLNTFMLATTAVIILALESRTGHSEALDDVFSPLGLPGLALIFIGNTIFLASLRSRSLHFLSVATLITWGVPILSILMPLVLMFFSGDWK